MRDESLPGLGRPPVAAVRGATGRRLSGAPPRSPLCGARNDPTGAPGSLRLMHAGDPRVVGPPRPGRRSRSLTRTIPTSQRGRPSRVVVGVHLAQWGNANRGRTAAGGVGASRVCAWRNAWSETCGRANLPASRSEGWAGTTEDRSRCFVSGLSSRSRTMGSHPSTTCPGGSQRCGRAPRVRRTPAGPHDPEPPEPRHHRKDDRGPRGRAGGNEGAAERRHHRDDRDRREDEGDGAAECRPRGPGAKARLATPATWMGRVATRPPGEAGSRGERKARHEPGEGGEDDPGDDAGNGSRGAGGRRGNRAAGSRGSCAAAGRCGALRRCRRARGGTSAGGRSSAGSARPLARPRGRGIPGGRRGGPLLRFVPPVRRRRGRPAPRPRLILGAVLPWVGVLAGVQRPVGAGRGAVPGRPPQSGSKTSSASS